MVNPVSAFTGCRRQNYLLAIRRDSLGPVASLHEQRQQHHPAVLGSNMQRGDALAVAVPVRLAMPCPQQRVHNLQIASRHRMMQYSVACKAIQPVWAR